MSIERVLQVPRTDSSDACVVVYVSGQGPPSTNLTLLATDELYPYVANIRQRQLNEIRIKTYKGSEDEWQAVLWWMFQRAKPPPEMDAFVRQVELVAAVHDEQKIILTIRHMISGISQRLGTITLQREDAQEVDLFAWAGIAAQSGLDAERQIVDLQYRLNDQQQTIDKLNSQLQDLIMSKKKQEDIMLEKFRVLLNSKKAKIRDQMRILATVKVDQQVVKQIGKLRHNSGTKVPTPAAAAAIPSKTRKRKAKTAPVQSTAEHEEETDDVKDEEPRMAYEEVKFGESGDEDDFERRAMSPERTDSERTQDEDEDENENENENDGDGDGDASALPTRHRKGTVEVDGSVDDEAVQSQQSGRGVQAGTQMETEEPPPRRELPFGRAGVNGQPTRTIVDDDDETDDEL